MGRAFNNLSAAAGLALTVSCGGDITLIGDNNNPPVDETPGSTPNPYYEYDQTTGECKVKTDNICGEGVSELTGENSSDTCSMVIESMRLMHQQAYNCGQDIIGLDPESYCEALSNIGRGYSYTLEQAYQQNPASCQKLDDPEPGEEEYVCKYNVPKDLNSKGYSTITTLGIKTSGNQILTSWTTGDEFVAGETSINVKWTSSNEIPCDMGGVRANFLSTIDINNLGDSTVEEDVASIYSIIDSQQMCQDAYIQGCGAP